jgi:hypothetical protein
MAAIQAVPAFWHEMESTGAPIIEPVSESKCDFAIFCDMKGPRNPQQDSDRKSRRISGPLLVFTRQEAYGSMWLMELPEQELWAPAAIG